MDIADQAPQEILIVDDDPIVIQTLARALAGLGRLRYATRGQDAIRLALEVPPDLLLLDMNLPDMTGVEVWAQLGPRPEFQDVPLIVITGRDDDGAEEAGLAMGARDFIAKPIRPSVLAARAISQLRLKAAVDQLRQLATTDGLTGLHNRRCFDERLVRDWALTQRSRRPLALMLLDVDHFKRYNDTYGHLAGDQVLVRVAQALRSQARRPGDFVARYGGEEFVLLLPETDARGAAEVARAMLGAVTALAVPHAHGVDGTVSASIGVVCLDGGGDAAGGKPAGPFAPLQDMARFLGCADEALYASKQAGRARFTLSSWPPAQ